MAFYSYFFNSVGGDKKYSAEDFARALDVFASSGILFREESAFPNESGAVFRNANSNNKIVVAPVKAIIKGYIVRSVDSTNEPITIASAGAAGRKDLVCLEMNTTTRDIFVTVIQGTDTTYPTPIQTDAQYQLPLAQVSVPANYVTGNDTALTITDVRQWAHSNALGYPRVTYRNLTLENGWTNTPDNGNTLRYAILVTGHMHIVGTITHGTQTRGTILTRFPTTIDFPNSYWEKVSGRTFNTSIDTIHSMIVDINSKATEGDGVAKMKIGLGSGQFGTGWDEMEWVSINVTVPVIYTGAF